MEEYHDDQAAKELGNLSNEIINMRDGILYRPLTSSECCDILLDLCTNVT
jgi:hypothetical protein